MTHIENHNVYSTHANQLFISLFFNVRNCCLLAKENSKKRNFKKIKNQIIRDTKKIDLMLDNF
jgi:hypothetical protein